MLLIHTNLAAFPRIAAASCVTFIGDPDSTDPYEDTWEVVHEILDVIVETDQDPMHDETVTLKRYSASGAVMDVTVRFELVAAVRVWGYHIYRYSVQADI